MDLNENHRLNSTKRETLGRNYTCKRDSCTPEDARRWTCPLPSEVQHFIRFGGSALEKVGCLLYFLYLKYKSSCCSRLILKVDRAVSLNNPMSRCVFTRQISISGFMWVSSHLPHPGPHWPPGAPGEFPVA